VLVTAFRATLEEITAADLIVLLADATSGRFEEDLAVVEETLASIGAGTVPRIIAINKTDRVDTDTITSLRTLAGRSGDRVVTISALTGDNIPEFLDVVGEMLFSDGKEE